MKLMDFDFVEIASVRRAVVPPGDIRGDIAFQNDINTIMASLDGRNPPLKALGWMRTPVSALQQSMPPEYAAYTASA